MYKTGQMESSADGPGKGDAATSFVASVLTRAGAHRVNALLHVGMSLAA